MSIKGELRELGPCQRCSSPTEYIYQLSGPEGEGVRISVHSECPICGYKELKTLIFPLTALYSIRHLLDPAAKILVERMALVRELKSAEEARAVGTG